MYIKKEGVLIAKDALFVWYGVMLANQSGNSGGLSRRLLSRNRLLALTGFRLQLGGHVFRLGDKARKRHLLVLRELTLLLLADIGRKLRPDTGLEFQQVLLRRTAGLSAGRQELLDQCGAVGALLDLTGGLVDSGRGCIETRGTNDLLEHRTPEVLESHSLSELREDLAVVHRKVEHDDGLSRTLTFGLFSVNGREFVAVEFDDDVFPLNFFAHVVIIVWFVDPL